MSKEEIKGESGGDMPVEVIEESKHRVKRDAIFCPIKGEDIKIGMGSACEICPNCGAYL